MWGGGSGRWAAVGVGGGEGGELKWREVWRKMENGIFKEEFSMCIDLTSGFDTKDTYFTCAAYLTTSSFHLSAQASIASPFCSSKINGHKLQSIRSRKPSSQRMKLVVASLLVSAANGFTVPSLANVRSSSLNASPDLYAPLLDKLNNHVSSAAVSSSSSVSLSQIDTQQKLLDALSSTLDAANNAIVASAEVSKLRPIGAGEVQPLPFMLDAQTKLASIESQLHDIRTSSSPNEVDFSALYASLNSVLDTSIQAAEQAAHSSTEVVERLVDFNVALSHSMGAFDLATLSNIGDALHDQLGSLSDGISTTSVAVNINDAGFQSFLSTLDRKLDSLSFDVSSETTGILIGYGMLAFLMGYAQNMGVGEYKMNLRRKMEVGEFDVEEVSGIL